MTVVALTNFITITTASDTPPNDLSPNKFQNGKHGAIGEFQYLSFLYQGAARNRSGDNMESSLILANNAIGMNHAREAVDNKYHIDVDTFLMNTDFTTNKLLTRETWLAASLSYDPTTVEVLLSSAIDAVGANAPNKVLTTAMVGHLPITGTIQSR